MKKFYAFAAAAVAALSMNAASIYVVGAGEGLSWDLPGEEITADADGNFVLEIAGLTQFKFSTVSTESWDEFDAAGYQTDGEFDEGVSAAAGQTLPLIPQADPNPNIEMPWKGDYTITIKGDYSAITAATTTEAPTGPADVYLRGSFDEGWAALDEWKFGYDPEADVYFLNCFDETALTVDMQFKIADADWGTINFGAEGTIEPDAAVPVELVYNGGNMTLSEDFEGVIYFKYVGKNGSTATFDPEAEPEEGGNDGIESAIFDSADAPAVYFNLQGVRVANPENGLYIVRQGNNVTKVIVK